MSKESSSDYDQLVRFFERQSEWLGLPRNTGLVLTSLYLAKFKSGTKQSVDEICEFTNYSRSNVGLILAQLEALGLVYGASDFKQKGRGRRRILYSIDDDSSSIITLGIRKMVDQLEEILANIDTLISVYKDDLPYIAKMLKELKKSAQKNYQKLGS